MMNFTSLQSTLRTLDHHFKMEAGKSVNRLLTIRNWLFGFYIVEFQQNGADRAAYGEQLLEQLAKTMKQKSFSYRNLRLYRQFCLSYPQMGRPIAQFMSEDAIWQTQSVRLRLIPNEFKSFEHLGEIKNGVEDLSAGWSGLFENYSLRETDGGTEWTVHIDMDSKHSEYFKGIFPKALAVVKELAEG